jgi:hypothetical protein
MRTQISDWVKCRVQQSEVRNHQSAICNLQSNSEFCLLHLFLCLVLIHQVGRGPANRKCLLLASLWLEAHPNRPPLPRRRRTQRIRSGIFSHAPLERFLENGLTAAQLRHHGIGLLSVVAQAAIGNVVSVPTRCRIISIKCRQIYGCNSSCCAVHQQPSSALPLPARSRFLRQPIIHAKGSSYDEQSFRNLVRRTHEIFLDSSIHQECPYLHRQRPRASLKRCKPLHSHPFSKPNHVHFACCSCRHGQQK